MRAGTRIPIRFQTSDIVFPVGAGFKPALHVVMQAYEGINCRGTSRGCPKEGRHKVGPYIPGSKSGVIPRSGRDAPLYPV